jgi:hypothetical protein
VAGVFWALADLSMVSRDVSGLVLTLQPGLRVSGRLGFAGSLTPPVDLRTVRLRLADVTGSTSVIPWSSTQSDGSFEISGVPPGAYTVTSSMSADAGWRLRSVIAGGRDILDEPLEVTGSGDVGGLVATFTDRRTELTGTLQSAASLPAPEYFVVVFPPDRAHWRLASRRVQYTRPGTDGRFTFRDLPSGDYLIAALTDLEPDDLADVSFMEQLAAAAVKVALPEGGRTTQDLRIGR